MDFREFQKQYNDYLMHAGSGHSRSANNSLFHSNDFREFREEYNDYLMHYGRKGMKWDKHIFGKDDRDPEGKRNNYLNEQRYEKQYGKRKYFENSLGNYVPISGQSLVSSPNHTNPDDVLNRQDQNFVSTSKTSPSSKKQKQSDTDKALQSLQGMLSSHNTLNRVTPDMIKKTLSEDDLGLLMYYYKNKKYNALFGLLEQYFVKK